MKAGQSIYLKYQRLHAIFEAILVTLLEAQQRHVLDNIVLTLGGITKCVLILKYQLCCSKRSSKDGNLDHVC
jgi:hypothetical protein